MVLAFLLLTGLRQSPKQQGLSQHRLFRPHLIPTTAPAYTPTAKPASPVESDRWRRR